MIGRHQISGFTLTFNEEKNIRDCLESLKWVDELVVVDSGSEDRTLQIVREYTDRIIEHPFEGHVAQTRFAAEQTSLAWVLWLDADERLTQEALDEIHAFFTGPDCEQYAGVAFPRKTFFLNRWITHSGWYPQPKVRLFHRDSGTVGGKEPAPAVTVSGKVKYCRGDILHFTYRHGLRDMVATTNKYTDYAARERHEAGKRFSWTKLLLEPPLTFLQKYLIQRGFMDGLAGLAIAWGTAYYKLLREIKMWEIEHPESRPPLVPPTTKGADS